MTTKRFILSLCLLLLYCCSAFATRKERLIDSWKPLNYNVTITFNNDLSEITNARAVVTIQAVKDVSVVDFDFGELAVDAVTVDGSIVTFSRQPGLLLVSLTKPLLRGARADIGIEYHGAPRDGLILSKDNAGKPSAVGDNWPNRVHHWIPCLDHPSAKASVTFTVTAPANDLVVANGKFVQVQNSSPSNRTWTFSEASLIPAYCMIIAVGEFAKVETPEAPVTPLAYYVPAPDRDNAAPGFVAANPSLKFFSETIAPYPYEKLALIVGATRFGGMENSGAIVFPNRLLESNTTPPLSKVFKIREGLVSVVAHEIAHQWFGDSVTEATWADLWLSEGFATYYAALMIQRYEGEEAFREYMRDAANTYFSFAKTTLIPIHDTQTEDLFKLLNANNYQKGAWVLHMLRAELGDDAFFRGIRAYYLEHAGGLASSDDLQKALERASGKNLKEFFARWVYGVGHPRYELSWTWNRKTKRLKLVLDQTQTESVFPNAVPITVMVQERAQHLLIKPESKRTIKEIKINQSPSSLTLDPDNLILDDSRAPRKQY